VRQVPAIDEEPRFRTFRGSSEFAAFRSAGDTAATAAAGD